MGKKKKNSLNGICSLPRKGIKSTSNILKLCLARWPDTPMNNEFISHAYVMCNETLVKTLEQLEQ